VQKKNSKQAPVKRPKKRASSANKKALKQNGLSRFIRFWLLRLSIVLMVTALAGVAYLDISIRKAFEGQKWALPAHVYTRPMELYLGQRIPLNVLQQELHELGYQRRENATRVGSYSLTGNRLHIYQRSFQFWDEFRPEQVVTVNMANEQIVDLSVDEQAIEIVRLEPRLFGSVSPLSHEDRSLLALEDVPQDLIYALLAIEDRQFYSHFGVNPLGIIRAMVRNITAGRLVQGGSTITQQLVKNYYLNSERTVKRKLIEMVMAVLLEVHYSKEQILQAYLNEVYLSQAGNRAIHGFALGSQYFFGRPLQELELPQMAMLAGMLKGPTLYNPLKNPKNALKRRNLVLSTMFDEEYIDKVTLEQAQQSTLGVTTAKEKVAPLSYPAFLGFVRHNLKQDYNQQDLQNDGLNIYTTLNPRIQQGLEQSVSQELNSIEKGKGLPANTLQVAAVVVRTDNGEVAAMVGGRKAGFSGYNRALDARRPIGSLIKPFIYLTALESPQQFHLASRLDDKSIVVSQAGSADWKPQNYDGKEHGSVMLVDALARSYNLSAVQLGMTLGVDNVVSTLDRLGHSQPVAPLPSVLLGAVSMNIVDVAQLYLSIASGGFKTPIKGIRSVLSRENEPLSRYSLSIDQVIEPEFNTLISYALQDVVRRGTARSVLSRFQYDYGLAGKTGTTNDYRDSWFAGFSGNYLTVVWVGRDDNQSTGLTGASGAAKVWSQVMSQMPMQRLDLNYSEDVITGQVLYTTSGSLTECNQARQLPFARLSLPLDDLPCGDVIEEPIEEQERKHFEPKKRDRRKKNWLQRIFG